MATILVVDDSAVERRRVGSILAKGTASGENGSPPRLLYAANGREALDVIARDRPDLVVTDLKMPEMDGLGLVREVRQAHPAVPVILMTAHGSESIAAQALRAGAAGYVPKRELAEDLCDTVETTLGLARSAREEQLILEHLTDLECRFLLHNDLNLIPPLVGFLQNNVKRLGLCDAVDELRVTISLNEALTNAVVHGNLEAPPEVRERDHAAYEKVVRERRHEAPYRDRRVHVRARETPAEVVYVIRDEGRGFNPADLPDPTDPANLRRAAGRGLFLIRTFMDEVRFNAAGNEITMIKRRTS
jgi:CheY-like chemotaxis protein